MTMSTSGDEELASWEASVAEGGVNSIVAILTGGCEYCADRFGEASWSGNSVGVMETMNRFSTCQHIRHGWNALYRVGYDGDVEHDVLDGMGWDGKRGLGIPMLEQGT